MAAQCCILLQLLIFSPGSPAPPPIFLFDLLCISVVIPLGHLVLAVV